MNTAASRSTAQRQSLPRLSAVREADVPAPAVSDVEVCHDARGDLLAYCSATHGGLRVDLPDLASFCYEYGADDVTAVPHRELAPEFLLDTYHHCVLPLILPALGTSVLHASAVLRHGGVVALCGASGTGKSTIALALVRRGYDLWADDAVAVDTARPRPMAIPLPFAPRLHPDAVQVLGDADKQTHSRPDSHENVEAAPLALLCILQRAPDMAQAIAIERLNPASACKAALSHAYCFSVKDPVHKRQTVESYLALTARVPVYELRFRPGFEHLPAVLDAIEYLMQ
jgi:hypothetical protein